MALPEKLTAAILTCEKVLQEADGVMSAIRLADIFFVPHATDLNAKKHMIAMHVLFTARFLLDKDAEATIELRLLRPGDKKIFDLGGAKKFPIQTKAPDRPTGFSIVLQANFIVQRLGLYEIVGFLDGQEIARGLFTVTEAEQELPQQFA